MNPFGARGPSTRGDGAGRRRSDGNAQASPPPPLLRFPPPLCHALVAAGPTTPPAGNGEGLWLFTREQVVSAGTVAQLRSVAEGKGFDLSVLRPVPQAGCVFYDTWPGR